jgi:hypothetical protein
MRGLNMNFFCKAKHEIPLADDKAILIRTPIQYSNNHTTLNLPKQMAQ